jgi:hypothetical protein
MFNLQIMYFISFVIINIVIVLIRKSSIVKHLGFLFYLLVLSWLHYILSTKKECTPENTCTRVYNSTVLLIVYFIIYIICLFVPISILINS